jgi:hypothetical protein
MIWVLREWHVYDGGEWFLTEEVLPQRYVQELMMIKDLQRQVAELTTYHLGYQDLRVRRMDGRDSISRFESPYHVCN